MLGYQNSSLRQQCPIDWYSKKQGTVETVTFGSEVNAARTAMEQIINLHGTLHYMGVPLRDSSYMFGDNTVVDSGSLPHAKLHKRHTMLSYHHIHEAITSGMVKFFHIPGEINPADILSKHWGHQQIWKQLQLLLFWKGDTQRLLRRSTTRKPTASLNGETLPTKVVAIEPILGSVKYEARSHYHSVFRGDLIHSRVQQCSIKSSFISVREIIMVTCFRKWGVTRFQQV